MYSPQNPAERETRKQFHAIFNQWLENGTQAELEQLDKAHQEVACGQVCSMFTLVRSCLRDQTLLALLPQSLIAPMQNWSLQPIYVGASAR